MTTDELKQRAINEILALFDINEIPPNAICVSDLMKTGMGNNVAQRKLLKLYREGKLQRQRGPGCAYYYWTVEDNKA